MKRRNIILYSCFIAVLFMLLYGCDNKTNLTSISSNGTKVNFTKLGNGEPTLIFIHGWSNNRSIWDSQMAHFSKKYQVIAMDLPGFGNSGRNRNNWSMSTFGEDVAAIIQELELNQVVLVGFSMGAIVAIEASLKDSDGLIGLVLVDQIRDVDLKYSPENSEFIENLFMDLIENPTKEKLVGGGFFVNNQEESYQKVVTMLQADSSRIGWRASLRDVFRWHNEDCLSAIEKVELPIALINSTKEPTNSEGLKQIASEINIDLVNEAGHVIMWNQPIEFNNLLEKNVQLFLEKNKK